MGQFVTAPYRSWTKVTQLAIKHASRENHQDAMAKMEEFMARYENPSHVIDLTNKSNRCSRPIRRLWSHFLKWPYFVASKASHYVDIAMMEYIGMMTMAAQMKAILFSWLDFGQKLISSLLTI